MVERAIRDVVDGEGTKGLEASFLVEVPPDALLRVLWAPTHFRKLFPDIEEARVIRDDGQSVEVEYRVDAVVRKVRYVLQRTLDPAARTIIWREVAGDLRRVRGGWRVEPSEREGESRVTYRAFVDVGRFVPTALVRDAAKRKLGEMIERVRQVAAAIHAATHAA
jgi:ribosome-associated toxin RatA of RatAB toxin-antitoxin module